MRHGYSAHLKYSRLCNLPYIEIRKRKKKFKININNSIHTCNNVRDTIFFCHAFASIGVSLPQTTFDLANSTAARIIVLLLLPCLNILLFSLSLARSLEWFNFTLDSLLEFNVFRNKSFFFFYYLKEYLLGSKSVYEKIKVYFV